MGPLMSVDICCGFGRRIEEEDDDEAAGAGSNAFWVTSFLGRPFPT
jgi:hypothetical protein